MSDTEQAPAVDAAEEQVEAPAVKEEEAPSLVLPPGERIRKPVRPDDTELRASTEVLQQQINKNKARMAEIAQLIEDKKSGRSEGSKEQQAVKSKLAELKAAFQNALSQKQAVRGQLDAVRKTRENMRTSLKEMKSNMKFTTVEDIDLAIARLEERVNHTTLTLNEEKRILEDIKKLKQSRATVGQYSDKLSQLAQDDSAQDDLVGQLKTLDEKLNGIKAQEEALREQLAEIREREAAKGSDIPLLYQERDECREICKQAYEKIKDLRAEHQAKWEAYKQQNALFNLQWQEDRKRKQEAYLAERARRDAERTARLAEMAGEPFDKEVTMCEQVLNYLSKYVAGNAATTEEKKAEVAVLEGFALLQKKDADEGDAWLLGTGKKAAKGGKGKAKKGSEAGGKAGAAPSDEKLSHSLDILEAFATLKLEVPLTRSKVPGVVEAVREKREHFLQRREEVKANGVPTVEPMAPAGEGDDEAGGEAAAGGDKPARKGGKGTANGKVELNLDDESWPSVSATAGGAAVPVAKWGGEEEGTAPAAGDAEDDDDEAGEEGGVSVALTVADEESPSVQVAITAH